MANNYTPYNGTFNIGGVDLINDGAGVRRADGKPWGFVGSGADIFAPGNNDWASIQQWIKSGGDPAQALGADLAPYANELMNAQDTIASQEHYAGAPLSEALKYGGLALGAGFGLQGLLGAGAGGAGTTAAASADAPWGVNSIGGNVADTNFDYWDFGTPDTGGTLMPPAIPETTQQLTDWGMKEISPGNWSQPAIGSAGDTLWKQIQQATGLGPKDALSLVGKLGGAALSYVGGQKQAGALQQLAQQNMAFGAPARSRFEASMSPGFDPMSIPGYSGALDTASKSILAKLSAQSGNPFGNPGGLIDANKQIVSGTALPAIQNYQNTNLNAGFGPGFGVGNAAATGAINADAGSLTGAAGAFGQLTAPDNSLAGLIAQLKASGIDTSGLKLSNGTSF